ncbi:hypothetical protein F511_34700 [Dorcoceras hygrometricum]|uniref:Uncharacterized protein n=1 Tax=Dorcoceras hygrometricum TaxID=472368 RepID=A0A2Z7BIM1_9LAMI|nr:hypothetical protein F511_34700 [Dorcoceras hygrometricum]
MLCAPPRATRAHGGDHLCAQHVQVGGRRRAAPCATITHDGRPAGATPAGQRAAAARSNSAHGIQLAVGPQRLRLRNHNFGLTHRIMVKRLATSSHDPLGITDSACKNQSVVVSIQYGPFNTYIPIRSTTIGKSRVASDPITMHTSRRSNSDIACVTRNQSSRSVYQLTSSVSTGKSSQIEPLSRTVYEPGNHRYVIIGARQPISQLGGILHHSDDSVAWHDTSVCRSQRGSISGLNKVLKAVSKLITTGNAYSKAATTQENQSSEITKLHELGSHVAILSKAHLSLLVGINRKSNSRRIQRHQSRSKQRQESTKI